MSLFILLIAFLFISLSIQVVIAKTENKDVPKPMTEAEQELLARKILEHMSPECGQEMINVEKTKKVTQYCKTQLQEVMAMDRDVVLYGIEEAKRRRDAAAKAAAEAELAEFDKDEL